MSAPDAVGQKSLEKLPGFTEDSLEQALSAGQSGIGYKRSVDVATVGSPHLIKTADSLNIGGAATAGVLPEQPLPALGTSVEAASAAFLDALDYENLTAKLYLQKAAHAADESWQQTVQGHNGPTGNPTIPDIEQSGSTSQHDDDDFEPAFAPPRRGRLNAPQLQEQLFGLSDRTRLRRWKGTLVTKGAWQQATRIEDLCHTHFSRKWLHQCAGNVLTPHDKITNVQKLGNRNYTGFGQSRLLSLSPEKRAAPPKPPRGTLRAFTPSKDSRTQESPRNTKDLQKHNPDRLIFSPPLLSQHACTCV